MFLLALQKLFDIVTGWQGIVMAAVLAIISFGGWSEYEFHKGYTDCQTEYKAQENKEIKKLEDAYGKIDKSIPTTRSAAIRRLQQHAN